MGTAATMNKMPAGVVLNDAAKPIAPAQPTPRPIALPCKDFLSVVKKVLKGLVLLGMCGALFHGVV